MDDDKIPGKAWAEMMPADLQRRYLTDAEFHYWVHVAMWAFDVAKPTIEQLERDAASHVQVAGLVGRDMATHREFCDDLAADDG